ncbi:tape measure protein [Labrenzia sp. R4_2]|uniref:tape measure protein n=1 Tax=Labrenzia sp. R4_2 TaxID=2821107 RepID=UPI001ADA862F|nr:tape measure protein [Labrenzia sp. R4_2]MBO9421704.1 tape measure protein [Labrenzia sp. R4_2]
MADMRLGIVAEYKDRASKRLQKLLKVNERMERANRAQAKLAKSQVKSQTKLAAATSRLERLMSAVKAAASGVSAPIVRAAAAMSRFTGHVSTAIRRAFSLRAALDRTRRGAALMGKGLGRIASGAMVAGGLALGAGGTAAGIANLVIGPAAQNEAYMVQLEALEGSALAARKAMDWIGAFELKTPLELPQLIEAYRQLKTFGIDPTNGTMEALVDTMAMSGGGAENLSGIILAVGQAWTKGKLQGEEALQLLERGVPVWDLLSKATGQSAAKLQEMASKGELGRDVIAKLVELMGERAAGASQKMAKTWDGMVSTMSSFWWKFRLMIAEAGVFEWAKEKLQGLLDTVNAMAADGTLLKLAQTISENVITTLEGLWRFGVEAYGVFEELGVWLSFAADMLGGWNNLAMVLIGLPLASTILSVVTGVIQLVSGFALLASGIATLSLPIVAVIAGVAALAAGAWYVYNNWDQVTAWFAAAWDWVKDKVGAAWDGITSAASTAWSWFKENLSWHPLALIANNWDAIKTFFADLWSGIQEKASSAWDTLKSLFAWSPLGLIIANWSEITTWVSGFFDGLSEKASAGWDKVKALFDFDWPEMNWPDLTMPVPQLPEGFSGWVSGAFDTLVTAAENGWDRLKAIFATMQDAAAGLGEAIASMVSGAVDAAGQALNALRGARGVDRIFADLSGMANTSSALNPFSSDFDKGYALTEALQAGQMSLQTYRAELAKVVESGGAFAEVAAQMLEASKQLDAFQMPEAKATVQDPARIEAAQKAIAATEEAARALPGIVGTAIAAVRSHLDGVDFAYQGGRMMDTIAAGMRARAHVVVAEMRKVAQALRDHLPSSPAKVGPLSDIHRLKFSETMARSIRPGPLVAAMRRTAAATMAAASLTVPSLAGAAPSPITPSQSALAAPATGASTSARNGGSGGRAISITYSPSISIEGSAIDEERLQQILRDNADELVALIRERLDEDERLEF